MKKLLASLLRLLANRLDPVPEPTDIDLAVDAAPLATAIVNGGTEALKVYAQLKAVADSPDRIKAAQAQQKLDEIDQLVTAQKNKNLEAQRLAAENARP